jgi:hypothetical protein
LEPIAPKVAQLLLDAESDLLGFYAFPREHWSKLRSTNPLERVNREIGRRTDVVGIFPNDAALIRLAGATLIEQNDEWLISRRYLSQESLSSVLDQDDHTLTKENNKDNYLASDQAMSTRPSGAATERAVAPCFRLQARRRAGEPSIALRDERGVVQRRVSASEGVRSAFASSVRAAASSTGNCTTKRSRRSKAQSSAVSAFVVRIARPLYASVRCRR